MDVNTTRPGAFAVNVRDIVRRAGEMREHALSVVIPEQWGEGIVSVRAGTQVNVEARLESVHEGILVSADIETEYVGDCSRCLEEVIHSVEVDFQELFAYSSEEATDFEVQENHVDLETPVRDAIVLSLPFQPVCQEDCPGLDPVTGKRLTVKPSERAEAPIDPRWAALQGLTDQAEGISGAELRNTEES